MQKENKTMAGLRKRQSRFMTLSLLLFALAFLGIGWALLKPKAASQPKVISLNENWSKLENSAHTWQKDAFLTYVNFFIVKTRNPDALQMVAEFHSLQVPNDQIVQVAIYNDGRIVNSPRDTMSILSPDPGMEELIVAASGSAENAIRQGDWTIDSQDALNTFAEDQEITLCLGSPQSIIGLSLNKMHANDPTWELIIAECPHNSNVFESYYLNAKTGERFDPFKP